MVDFGKFVHTRNGRIIMSILLGFGLATLFRQVCEGRDCYSFKAPPLEDIEDKIYSYDGKCYKYDVKNTACKQGGKKVVDFA